MFPEEELVMISAIEHYSYCPRQCALIHVESIYHENVLTLRGNHAHTRSDEPVTRMERGIRIERALPLWSDRLGLTGIADVVEFHPDGAVFPVEHKVGKTRGHHHAALQLCAQALCLEEMLAVAVPFGALFSHETRRREEVALGPDLRRETEQVVAEIRRMRTDGHMPPPVNDRRCPRCSLVDACVPGAVAAAAARSARSTWVLEPEEAIL